MEIVIKIVEGCGYLPIVLDEFGNVCRHGEYKNTAADALNYCLSFIDETTSKGVIYDSH
tara:strand:- start:501 stop:677 length:177 start_codon:yes stop_codon:yes gene_type:complete